MTQNKEAIAKAPSGRVTRTPVSQRNILTVKGKDPNYEYRIVNDVEDRITQFLDAGYVIDENESVDVGDKRVSTGSGVSPGSKKMFSVGNGTKAFVMKIKREWYEEDQAAKQQKVDLQESSIKEKALSGTYGDLKITRD
jgi:hypothetical protein